MNTLRTDNADDEELRHLASQLETELGESRARIALLEKKLLDSVQSLVSLASHLEGPNGWTISEPGQWMEMLHVFPDGSGFVRELKKISPDRECYPCMEWKSWHEGREKLKMPYKIEDILPLTPPEPVDGGKE